MIPSIRNTPTYTLNIPKLSGGVNLRDGLTLINDNQLTDVKNMWFKDGMLRTRPSVNSNSKNKVFQIDNGSIYDVKTYPDVVCDINGKRYQVFTLLERRHDGDYSEDTIYIYCQSTITEDDLFKIGEISCGEATIDNQYSYFLVSHNNKIYCYWCTSNPNSTDITDFWGSSINPDDIYGTHYQQRRSRFSIFEFSYAKNSNNKYSWVKTSVEGSNHAPLVAINCKYAEGTDIDNSEITGTLLYGHNLLCDYVKAKFTTVNKDIVVADGETNIHPMIYKFPTVQNGFDVEYQYLDIVAEITDEYGYITKHELMLSETGGGCEENVNTDGLRMCGNKNGIWFENANGKLAYITKNDVKIENNMVVTYPSMIKETDKVKAFKMTGSMHYGNRVFLFGNIMEKESSLILWSDVNNPLYISENNYIYVGSESQRVTALGKQSDKLIIFKEHEIYQTQYVQGNEVSASSVINQEVVDLSTTSAYFPLTQVHNTIGCDCPNTVQLCRNRLVWLSSEGKVYTLVSQSQYNERSVLCVSEMVNRKLENEKNLKSAQSADWLGHYVLSVDKNMYLMDYNSYGYNYISSFTKEDDANIKIPWYYWELPVAPEALICSTNKLVFRSVFDEYYTEDDEYYSGALCGCFYLEYNFGASDTNDIIYTPCLSGKYQKMILPKISMIKTKLFDFGRPDILKSVPIVNIAFGDNKGRPMLVEFLSEKSLPDSHYITVSGLEAEEYSPEFISTTRIFPYTKGTVRFGIKVSVEGELKIDSISLQHKNLGGAK